MKNNSNDTVNFNNVEKIVPIIGIRDREMITIDGGSITGEKLREKVAEFILSTSDLDAVNSSVKINGKSVNLKLKLESDFKLKINNPNFNSDVKNSNEDDGFIFNVYHNILTDLYRTYRDTYYLSGLNSNYVCELNSGHGRKMISEGTLKAELRRNFQIKGNTITIRNFINSLLYKAPEMCLGGSSDDCFKTLSVKELKKTIDTFNDRSPEIFLVNNDDCTMTEPVLVKEDNGKITVHTFHSGSDKNHYITKHLSKYSYSQSLTIENRPELAISHDGHCSAFSFFKATQIKQDGYQISGNLNGNLNAIHEIEKLTSDKKTLFRLQYLCGQVSLKDLMNSNKEPETRQMGNNNLNSNTNNTNPKTNNNTTNDTKRETKKEKEPEPSTKTNINEAQSLQQQTITLSPINKEGEEDKRINTLKVTNDSKINDQNVKTIMKNALIEAIGYYFPSQDDSAPQSNVIQVTDLMWQIYGSKIDNKEMSGMSHCWKGTGQKDEEEVSADEIEKLKLENLGKLADSLNKQINHIGGTSSTPDEIIRKIQFVSGRFQKNCEKCGIYGNNGVGARFQNLQYCCNKDELREIQVEDAREVIKRYGKTSKTMGL